MKLGTYVGLVARRLWAKKGILIGSFLGATLVTALLVVVPLYESSVQGVDLRFTMRGAVADDIDMTAFSPTNDYTRALGASNRAIVNDAYGQWLVPWYPTIEEGSLTREYAVIPTAEGTDGDWSVLAKAWRDTVDALANDGTPQDEWPSPPYPRPPREALQVRIFTAPDLEGAWSSLKGSGRTRCLAPRFLRTDHCPS